MIKHGSESKKNKKKVCNENFEIVDILWNYDSENWEILLVLECYKIKIEQLKFRQIIKDLH